MFFISFLVKQNVGFSQTLSRKASLLFAMILAQRKVWVFPFVSPPNVKLVPVLGVVIMRVKKKLSTNNKCWDIYRESSPVNGFTFFTVVNFHWLWLLFIDSKRIRVTSLGIRITVLSCHFIGHRQYYCAMSWSLASP